MELETIQEDKREILMDGLSALASIKGSCHAVSTKNRFNQFCKNNSVEYIERDFNWRDLKEGFEFDGREFEFYQEFRQTGYGAWHIGSAIDGVREKGKNILIINGRRNRRFLMIERRIE